MSKPFRIILPLLAALALIVSALYLVAVGFFSCDQPSKEALAETDLSEDTLAQLRSEYKGSEELRFGEELYTMEAGERLTPELEGEERLLTALSYSSSDSSVATVDKDGCITATGYGVCVISAKADGASASVGVSVGGDILALAQEALEALGNGSVGGAYLRASEVRERLARCELDGAVEYCELFEAILAFATGDGDKTALVAAISKSGQDSALCRRAALACLCKSEMLSNDAIISFTGDVTLTRFNERSGKGYFPYIYEKSGSETYPFDLVKCVFAMDSLSVVNFEGALTDSVIHEEKSYYFRGSPEYAKILRNSFIEAANLENNHASDYGAKGFSDTVDALNAEMVTPFWNSTPYITTVAGGGGGGRVALLSFCWASGSTMDEETREEIVSSIRRYKSSDCCIILNLHWGKERSETPEQWQIDAAHEFIDAGADLIIGHHPHVLQGIELYNGKYIVYSLGNFAFGGNTTLQSPNTLILRAKLGRVSGALTVTGISAIPCLATSTKSSENNYQPVICFGDEAAAIVSGVLRLSSKLPYGIGTLSSPKV